MSKEEETSGGSFGIGGTLDNSPVCLSFVSSLPPPPSPPPSLQSRPSLAPALLMIPRQEAELAWGSKVIFPLFLCQFLLFVTAFHWNFQA